ncbi:aldehyde dehydrogenase family protein [Saccharopolyspora sp. WRP15-2]|uniref:Aldehyde dehydrogenase family protein n=1 Tax=Saccharopolyspora oryzae TaxID=2997343 RepID=A0ABT4UWD0_9PSEU|nr:aldehyde dehydrogenase family protein [Saccharopolyspora oryzae]MDA3625516.1 aldehyde dehydrogenase family protein [Saccharopolyspora oryzae]
MTTSAPAPLEDQVWTPPAGGFWAGSWQDGDRRMPVRDPEDGSTVGSVVDTTDAEVDRAVAHLAEHWRPGCWPLWQRRRALESTADELSRSVDRFTAIIAAEGCKTVSEARAEVSRAVETLELAAHAAASLSGRTVPFDNTPRGLGWTGWHTREPLGIVAAITPFNDPLNLVAHKLGPALVADNAVVLKPAEQTPLSALALVELLLRNGVPGDRIAAVPGRTSGQALVRHPRIDVVSFTGGPRTADRIAQAGPARKLLMELGGNNALIVCSDADPDRVATAVVDGAFGVAGQNCLSVQRVLVHASRYRAVLERVVSAARDLVVGSKRDPATDVGPMIDADAAERVVRWIDEAVTGGATLHTGGQRRGTFVRPAVLTGAPSDARVRTDEVFGPVVLLDPFTDTTAAIDAANAVNTGLQAGVFTQDIDRAMTIANALTVGAVLINSTSDFRIDAMPFGGFKRSGIGREGVESAVQQLTEPKIIAINTGTPQHDPAA